MSIYQRGCPGLFHFVALCPGLFHFVALRPYYGMEEVQMHHNMRIPIVGAQCNEVE
jgi:hypothetical protein